MRSKTWRLASLLMLLCVCPEASSEEPASSASAEALAFELATASVERKLAITRMLRAMGSGAQAAIPALETMARFGEDEARQVALLALLCCGKESAASLIGLADQDPAVLEALLKQMPRSGRSGIGCLAELLRQGQGRIQLQAARSLGWIGRLGHEVVPLLSDYLEGGSPELRLAVVEALNRFGDRKEPAAPLLIDLFRDKSTPAKLRAKAGAELGDEWVGQGLDVRELFSFLDRREERSEDVRQAAVKIIAEAAGWQNEIVAEQLRRVLENSKESPQVRGEAARGLRRHYSKPQETIKLLRGALKSKHVEIRIAALAGLAGFGHKADRRTVKAITQLIKDPEVDVREAAVRALGSMRGDPKSALAGLKRALSDRVASVRGQAVWSIGYLGEKAAPVARQLLRLLDDDNEWIRRGAVFGLSNMGKRAHSAIPVLTRMLGDSSTTTRTQLACLDALTRMGGDAKRALPTVRPFLTDQNFELRWRAWQALHAISKAAAPSATSILLPALDSDDAEKRRQAINETCWLRNLPDVDALIEGLINCLKDENEMTRASVIGSLRTYGKLARVAVPELIAALGDPDLVVRVSAARALGSIAAPQEQVFAALQVISDQDSSWRVREAASSALAALGRRGS